MLSDPAAILIALFLVAIVALGYLSRVNRQLYRLGRLRKRLLLNELSRVRTAAELAASMDGFASVYNVNLKEKGSAKFAFEMIFYVWKPRNRSDFQRLTVEIDADDWMQANDDHERTLIANLVLYRIGRIRAEKLSRMEV